tara:strand:- start:8 stop:745 length:738 start_codon:yes stop_codon:yes gene_type:complete
MYCLFNGKTTETIAPPANSVDSGNVVSGAIDDSHITGMAASKLTGVVAPANLGTGTASASTFLNGAGAYAEAGGGAWTLIATAVASNSANLTITGLDNTYSTFAITFSDLVPVSDGEGWRFRVGDSGGVDSGGSDYGWSLMHNNEGASAYVGGASSGDSSIRIGYGATGNATGEAMGAIIYIHTNGTSFPIMTGFGVTINQSGVGYHETFSGHRKAVITLDRVQLISTSGNINTGRMTVYGIAHA